MQRRPQSYHKSTNTDNTELVYWGGKVTDNPLPSNQIPQFEYTVCTKAIMRLARTFPPPLVSLHCQACYTIYGCVFMSESQLCRTVCASYSGAPCTHAWVLSLNQPAQHSTQPKALRCTALHGTAQGSTAKHPSHSLRPARATSSTIHIPRVARILILKICTPPQLPLTQQPSLPP